MKKLTIQEFNQGYVIIDEKVMIFEEKYPDKKQFDYITNKVYHPEIKEYEVEYSAMLQLVHMGEVGKYRMDGVPFGLNAIIITIEADDIWGLGESSLLLIEDDLEELLKEDEKI